MKSLYKPTTFIGARNMGNASRESDTMTRGLDSVLFPSLNTGAMMMSNIIQYHGLFNGSTGIVRDILYKSD